MRKRAREKLFANSTSGRVKQITKLYHSLNFTRERSCFNRILIRLNERAIKLGKPEIKQELALWEPRRNLWSIRAFSDLGKIAIFRDESRMKVTRKWNENLIVKINNLGKLTPNSSSFRCRSSSAAFSASKYALRSLRTVSCLLSSLFTPLEGFFSSYVLLRPISLGESWR